MVENTLISIIIPVYNVAPYLRRCLDSVTAQTWKDLEIICVDDGSADESAEIMKEYAIRDKRIRCFYQKENKGQSAARNIGLDAAAGEWIIFVDSDDEVTHDMAECLLRTALREKVQLVKGSMLVIQTDSGQERRVIRKPCVKRGKELILWFLEEDVYRAPFPCIISSRLFTDLRFREGRIYEDTCLFMELLTRTDGCALAEELLYIYYMRPDGTVKGSPIEKKTDKIWVAQEITRCVAQTVPELEGRARARELERICLMLYMIDNEGRKKYPEQWKYTVDAIAAIRNKKMEKRFYHRVVLFLFSISPVLLVNTRKVYLRVTGFFGKKRSGKERDGNGKNKPKTS